MDDVCNWYLDVNWYTDCGQTYFRYIKDFPQPNISGTDECPWCGKVRNEVEVDEEE